MLVLRMWDNGRDYKVLSQVKDGGFMIVGTIGLMEASAESEAEWLYETINGWDYDKSEIKQIYDWLESLSQGEKLNVD